MSFRAFTWALLGLLPVLLGLAATVPPFDDELYYWCWSRDLQLSYYDHPPMVAYMIRASTELFGNSIFAIRLPAVLSGLVVIGVIAWLARPRDLLPFVLLSPVLTFAAILVTPDTPLLMFWASISPGLSWSTSGLPWRTFRSGCGSWVVSSSAAASWESTRWASRRSREVSVFCSSEPGAWLLGYLVHALVACAVASPILIHNIPQNFAPIRYQWSHSMSSPKPGLLRSRSLSVCRAALRWGAVRRSCVGHFPSGANSSPTRDCESASVCSCCRSPSFFSRLRVGVSKETGRFLASLLAGRLPKSGTCR